MKKLIVLFILTVIVVYAEGSADLHCPNTIQCNSERSVVLNSRQWIPITKPAWTADRLTHATAYSPDDDFIYMIGGTPNGQSGSNIGDNYAYDPNTDSWTNLSPMPQPVGWISGAYLNGDILIYGGYTNGGSASDQVMSYDVASDNWTMLGSMPLPRFAHCTVVWNNNTYQIGGYPPADTSVIRNGSSYCTSLPQGFEMGGCAVVDNTIYLVGGYYRNGSEVYTNILEGVINPSEPDSITWSFGDSLPYPNLLNAATCLNQKIYMLGGFMNGSVPTDQLWEYDPVTGTWTPLGSYSISVVRGKFLIGNNGTNELYAIAGDANGDWAPPNNYYSKYQIIGVNEGRNQRMTRPLLRVMPSVTNGITTISFNLLDPEVVSLDLYNANGQMIRNLYRGNAASNTIRLALHDLPGGIYFVNLEADGSVTSEKLVVTK